MKIPMWVLMKYIKQDTYCSLCKINLEPNQNKVISHFKKKHLDMIVAEEL